MPRLENPVKKNLRGGWKHATLGATMGLRIEDEGSHADTQRTDLAEDIDAGENAVEVDVRPGRERSPRRDIRDVLRSLPPGTRSKEDIDQQIREERASWGEA